MIVPLNICRENIIYTGIVFTTFSTYSFLDNKRLKEESRDDV